MKKISILGSTGSIGASALDVIRKNPQKFRVAALAAGRNVKLLARQALAFHPAVVSVRTPEDAKRLRGLLGPAGKIRVLCGEEGVREIASHAAADIVLSAISGAAGLKPTLAAIEAGKDIALANKETMVIAGGLVTRRAGQKKVRLLPVDSEHSAIFQCLAAQKPDSVKRIILTASGGPFYSFSRAQLQKVTPAQALRHPRWKMGAKITVDSASLMNKGLEVIEAKWLFDMDISRIDILIHPQSVVHSAIELHDGSVLAQMGIADMRIPIAYALSFPDRMTNDLPALDLVKAGPLAFFPPDAKKFPCLRLAFEAARVGGTAPVVLNAANEEAVTAFLENKICFHEIPKVIEKTLEKHSTKTDPSLEEILLADGEARKDAAGILNKLKRG